MVVVSAEIVSSEEDPFAFAHPTNVKEPQAPV